MKEYNVEVVEGETIISYEENGFRVSFGEHSGNLDYEEYIAFLAQLEAEKN